MKKLILFSIVTAFIFSGCANPYLGVTAYSDFRFPADTCHVGGSGHGKVTLKHIIIEYDYRIEDGQIFFDGTISCNENNVGGRWERADLRLDIYFIDKNFKVVQANFYSKIFPDAFCEEPLPFKASYPFKCFKGVKFAYNVKVSGDQQKEILWISI